MTAQLLAWHQTGYSTYEKIKRDGVVRAKKVPWYSRCGEMIWFTSSDNVDPVVDASLNERDRQLPLVRLGYLRNAAVLRFEEACTAAGMTRESYKRRIGKAASVNSSVDEWCAVIVDEIPLTSFSVEFFDRERSRWVDTRPSLTRHPLPLNSLANARWAAKMGLFSEVEYFKAAVRGELGTTHHEFVEGYLCGAMALDTWSQGIEGPSGKFRSDAELQGFMDSIALATRKNFRPRQASGGLPASIVARV